MGHFVASEGYPPIQIDSPTFVIDKARKVVDFGRQFPFFARPLRTAPGEQLIQTNDLNCILCSDILSRKFMGGI